MRLSPPKKTTLYIAVILAVIGLVFFFIPAVDQFAFWAMLLGFILLAAGNLVQGF